MDGYREIRSLIEPSFPGLLDKVREIIEESESKYVKNREGEKHSFLWEHTICVATFALVLCRVEKEDPSIPVVAALFHDIGKFDQGQYHQEDTPEEKISARIADEILPAFGLKEDEIKIIVSGLTALYAEKNQKNRIADILHDADFLSKSGYLGVAHFFTKSALKGQNLYRALSQDLSKELTYASVLPQNMRTTAGEELAEQKAKDSLAFYRNFLQELRDSGISRFKIREEELPCPQKKGRILKIYLVVPQVCLTCGDIFVPKFSFAQGIKCTELVAHIQCRGCSSDYGISFCLPEILC